MSFDWLDFVKNLDWKGFANKAKVPAGIVVMMAVLGLEIYNTVKGSKSGDVDESVKKIEAGVDALVSEGRADADTIKADIKEMRAVAQRTENKADEILEKVEECCDCNKQRPASRPVASRTVVTRDTVHRDTVRHDTVPAKTVQPVVIRDTVIVRDTVCPEQKPVKKYVVRTVWCYKVINER